jgi:hypothetical protein
MPKRTSEMTCEEFQKFVIDLIHSGADPEDAVRQPHATRCAICRQFVQEIMLISDAARSLFADEWKLINKPN